MAFRVDKPPLSVNLLNSEEARCFGLGVFVTTKLSVVEFSWAQGLFFLSPCLLELFQILDLAGPVYGRPLSELIYERLRFEDFEIILDAQSS